MNGAMAHRGPDDSGVFSHDDVTLGNVRLSIIDLTKAGKQPMSNENSTMWLVYNGEIYNYQSLRKQLQERGHVFKSQTDTEVVIHAYEEWGCSCVERFNGMWAFAIYDKTEGILFLSRDRYGIKPLYYFTDGQRFIFSSEIKPILLHDMDVAPNTRIIIEFLASGLVDHSMETFFANISRVMPGESLVYHLSSGILDRCRWYNPFVLPQVAAFSDEKELSGRVRDMFVDSVRFCLVSDVPIGSCLSGGIDSSSAVAVMRRLGQDVQLHTFSMVFPGLKIDETAYVDEVVATTKAVSHKVTPSVDGLLLELEDLIRTQEEPFQSPSIYGQYKVMELAHINNMKVLIDGQGGDEVLAGYPHHYLSYVAELILRSRIGEALRMLRTGTASPLSFIEYTLPRLLEGSHLSKIVLRALRRKRMKYLNAVPTLESMLAPFNRSWDLRQALLCDLVNSLPCLLRYEDKNSMRWSIESRVPFLDYRFVELLSAIPSNLKIREGMTKYCFRVAMDGIVPRRILERRDKIGFATPDSEWLGSREFLSVFERVFNSNEFASREYWMQSEVVRMLKRFSRYGDDLGYVLWRVLIVELWLRMFIDQRTRAS